MSRRLSRRRRSMPILLAVSALIWGIATPSIAELVRFRRGGEVLLPARLDGDHVRIQGPAREYVIPRSDIKELRADPTPDQEWRSQRRPRPDASGSEILAAVRWALARGLTDEASETLAQIKIPSPTPELQRMRTMRDRLTASPTAPNLEPIRQAIRGEFRIAESARIVLLHQREHDDQDAGERLRLLERVLIAFYLDAADRGLPVQPPARKLIHVYFAKRSAYQAYLRRDQAEGFQTTRGFYHPNRRAAIACDARDDSDQRRALGAIRAMTGSEAERRALLWELEWRRRDHGSAAHEMIHQLIDQSGLEPELGTFPLWLHEGWAAQFETVADGRWAGVEAIPMERLTDWRTIENAPNLAGLIARPWPQSRDAAYYARSWAFVRFLRQRRPDDFADGIHRLRAGQPAAKPFGFGVSRIEPEWKAFMSSIAEGDR